MDRNVALAVFLLFSIVADVSQAKRFRYLAGAPQQSNPTTAQVSGENKQYPNENGAVKRPENVQPSNNSPPLVSKLLNKADLVSPTPQNQTTDNSKNFNFPNPESWPAQNHSVNYEKTPKGVNNKENGKNLSPTDKGKNPERVSGTDLLSPDKGKNWEHVNDTDLSSPSVNETDNGKNGGSKEKTIDYKSNEMGNGKNGGAKEKTIDDQNNKTGNGKNGGVKEKTVDDQINETGNGKNDGVKAKTIVDKSNETDDGKNGGVKEKTIDDKSNETDNEKNGEAKEKTIDDKSNDTDGGKNGTLKEKTDDDKSNEADNGRNGGAKEKTIDDKGIQTDNGKIDRVGKKSIDDKSSSELGVNETCEGLHKCKDLETLIACIQSFDTGSRELTFLVQNDGEKTLIINLTIPTAIGNPLKPLKVSKHQTQKINILLSASKNTKLILNAGNGECVLHTDRREPEENFFIYLPSYNKLLTPINGAYFLILSVLVYGGTWAFCMCRKRGWNDGVPYQELEMGLHESVSATNVETAEGWDQGWDDDWDENNAVKSAGASRIGSISANGLTSRSPSRDGWENDWDD